MNMPQIRCCGCDRVFNPRGLSQHLSKPQNATCRDAQMALRTLSVFQTTLGAGSSLPSNSNSQSCDNHDMGQNRINCELYNDSRAPSMIIHRLQMEMSIRLKKPVQLNRTQLIWSTPCTPLTLSMPVSMPHTPLTLLTPPTPPTPIY
jgi:hypothetical protein